MTKLVFSAIGLGMLAEVELDIEDVEIGLRNLERLLPPNGDQWCGVRQALGLIEDAKNALEEAKGNA